jgi:hypothetical protein
MEHYEVIFKKLEEIIKKQNEDSEQKAVQGEKIIQLTKTQDKLCNKIDKAFSDTGPIAKIKEFQAACPKEKLSSQVNWIWCSVGSMAFAIVGKFWFFK